MMARLGKDGWLKSGGQWHRPCNGSAAYAAGAFDVVLVNLGIQYQARPQQMASGSGLYAQDVQLLVQEFERATEADPEKRFVFLQTSAQHFPGHSMTGAYEDRLSEYQPQVNVTIRSCYCSPSRFDIGWRNVRLREGLQQHVQRHHNIKLLPFYNLTQPRWDMHVALATQQHADGDSVPKTVCDCTHFCYDADFWTHSFFPTLESLLRYE